MMQTSRPQGRKLVTYGKSSRSQLPANRYKNRPTTAEQQSPKAILDPRRYHRSTDSSENNRDRSSNSSPPSGSSNILAQQHSPDIEVYDISFSSHPPRRKRKRSDSTESLFAPEVSTIFDPPSHSDNSPTTSSHAISKISHAPATASTRHPASPRKRLVDSLGTTEPPVKDSVTLNAPDSPSVVTPSRCSSSNRRKDLNGSPRKAEPHSDGSQQSAASSTAHLRNAKVTYARQRSFLNEFSFSSSIESQASAALLPEDYDTKQATPGRKIATQSNIYADHEENEDGGSVRGIHELRQAGENARFRGAVDSNFEEIEDACNSRSDPSSGFAQLCTNLLDAHMIRRFSDCGFEKRFLQCVTADLDTLSASFSLCAYELIRSGGAFSYTLLAPFLPSLLDLSSRLLSMDDDILLLARKHQRRTVSRAARAFVPRLSSLIHKDPTSKISPRLMALRCIQSVLSNCQEAGERVGAIPTTLLDRLVGLLTREMPPGAKNFPMPLENFQVLVLTLSILESCTSLSDPSAHESRGACQSLSQFSSILDMGAQQGDNGQCQQILTHYIRVVLNVTNDPSLCDTMSTAQLVNGLVKIVREGFGGMSEGSEGSTLDVVILALGALTNLAEKCTLSKAMFLTPASNSNSLLDQLLGLFSASVGSVLEAHSVSLPEVHHNVAIGYLSILLVTLSLDRDASSTIQKSLDGKGLAVILSIVKKFLQYHGKVEQDLPPDRKGSPTTAFTVRLQSIVSEVEQYGI